MASNNLGKVFEKEFKKSAVNENLWYYRIADSDLSFCGGNSKFTNKSMADCLIFYKRVLFVAELKSTNAKSISIQRKPDGQGMIKLHQIESLIDNNLHQNVEGCLILNFRDDDNPFGIERTYIMNISDFSDFLVMEDKSSINEKDILNYNGIQMKQEKKRKYYNYKISDVLDRYFQERGVENE
jgi:penicillin-binding protein-related factor A (putative recombinase)